MRAEDAIRALFQIEEIETQPGDLLADVMLREGIAYDELARFMMLGIWRAAHILDECRVDADGNAYSRADTIRNLHGRLWLDGFLAGHRMGQNPPDYDRPDS